MMKGKKKISAVFATLMLITGVFIVIPFPVHAQGAATLILPSKSWYVPIYDINTTALVPIKINTTDLVHSWEVSFTYDVAILQYLGATEADFLSKNGSTTFTPTGGAGQVDLNCTHNGASNETQGLGVPETIATVMFNITDYGKSALTFGSCNVVDTGGVSFSLTKVDGYWETRAKVTIALPSKSWFPPAYDIGSYFTMSLTIETVEKVSYWSTGIRFDNDTIEFISVAEGPFLSQVGSTAFNSGTNHNNGTVSGISCDHLGVGNYTQGQGYAETLATFTFRVKDLGKTVIDLTDVPGDLCETVVEDQNGDDCGLLELVDGSWELRALVDVNLGNVYLTTGTHSKGDSFTVDLTINTTEKVSAWQSGVRFDNTIVNCTGVSYGGYMTGAFPLTYTIDNGNGMVYGMGQTLTGGASATGAGLLATINFTILDYGKTTLDLTDLDLDQCEFIAIDNKGDELTVLNLIDGSFEFRAGVTVKLQFTDELRTVYPGGPPTPFPYSIDETFVIQLKIYTIEKVSAWQAGVLFNNTVLNCTSVSYGGYMTGAFPLTYTINNTLGMVYGMGQTLMGGATQTGNGVLATLTFKVIGSGWPIIELTADDGELAETLVTDQNGDECSYLWLVEGLRLAGDGDGRASASGNTWQVTATEDLVFGLAAYMGSKPGNATWNPNFDFGAIMNGVDGTIETGDLIFGYAPHATITWRYGPIILP
jgi:hypothetical protein